MSSTEFETINYGERGEVRVVVDGAALAHLASELFAEKIASAVNGRNATVALSGGSTPKAMAALLRTSEFAPKIPWDRAEFFWGDERWVPLDNPESNAGEALRGFLDYVAVPPGNIHRWEVENVSPEESADHYAETLARNVQILDGLPVFDLVLLGMGDDGHTASLFPGTSAVHESKRWTLGYFVPKFDAYRLTLTAPVINAAKSIIFLVGGAAKADRLARVLDGPIDIDTNPSQVIRPTSGELIWLVDRAAAGQLQKAR